MTTTEQAFAVIRARLEANTAIPLRWPFQDAPPVEDTPANFVFIDFQVDRPAGGPAGYGGGRGNNLWRRTAELILWLHVPRGQGFEYSAATADPLRVLFHSYRDNDISCFDSVVIPIGPGSGISPPGADSAVDNYDVTAVVTEMHFDQIG